MMKSRQKILKEFLEESIKNPGEFVLKIPTIKRFADIHGKTPEEIMYSCRNN